MLVLLVNTRWCFVLTVGLLGVDGKGDAYAET